MSSTSNQKYVNYLIEHQDYIKEHYINYLIKYNFYNYKVSNEEGLIDLLYDKLVILFSYKHWNIKQFMMYNSKTMFGFDWDVIDAIYYKINELLDTTNKHNEFKPFLENMNCAHSNDFLIKQFSSLLITICITEFIW